MEHKSAIQTILWVNIHILMWCFAAILVYNEQHATASLVMIFQIIVIHFTAKSGVDWYFDIKESHHDSRSKGLYPM